MTLNNPPIDKKCIGITFDASKNGYETGIDSWKKSVDDRYLHHEKEIRWTVEQQFVGELGGRRPIQKPKGRVVNVFHDTDPPHSKLRLNVSQASAFLQTTHSVKETSFEKLRDEFDKSISSLASEISITECRGVEVHYHNSITAKKYPALFDFKEQRLALSQVIKHFSKFNVNCDSFFPPTCQVPFVFDKQTAFFGEMSIYPRIADNAPVIAVDLKASWGRGLINPIADSVAELVACRRKIEELFQEAFTETAISQIFK